MDFFLFFFGGSLWRSTHKRELIFYYMINIYLLLSIVKLTILDYVIPEFCEYFIIWLEHAILAKNVIINNNTDFADAVCLYYYLPTLAIFFRFEMS